MESPRLVGLDSMRPGFETDGSPHDRHIRPGDPRPPMDPLRWNSDAGGGQRRGDISMRILFFSYAYPNAAQPTLGTFNRSMLAALAQQHDVRVVSPVSFIEAWRSRFSGKSAL